MIGRYLELSVTTDRILESVQFWESLGLAQAVTGEMWRHRYGVVSDGRMNLGLHELPADVMKITFTRADLEAATHELAEFGILPPRAELEDDSFHQLEFDDPDGHRVRLVEARTFSPIPESDSRLGRFESLVLPCRDTTRGVAFWEPLGFVALEETGGERPEVLLCSDLINLRLRRDPAMRAPALRYTAEDMDERVRALLIAQHPVQLADDDAGGITAELISPEGTRVELHPET